MSYEQALNVMLYPYNLAEYIKALEVVLAEVEK